MPGLPVATILDTTDMMGGLVGALGTMPPYPIGLVGAINTSVYAAGKLVSHLGAPVAPHGNYYQPFIGKTPQRDYNPVCGKATVALKTIATITVENKPLAVWTSVCSCGHFIIPGAGAIGASIQAGGL